LYDLPSIVGIVLTGFSEALTAPFRLTLDQSRSDFIRTLDLLHRRLCVGGGHDVVPAENLERFVSADCHRDLLIHARVYHIPDR